MPPSSSVRYIETNSLWAIATGRDPDAIRLLKNPPLDLCLALPQVCVMEAFSVLNATRRQKNQFRNSLDRQISAMRRDATSPHAKILFAYLERARVAGESLLEDTISRLGEAIERLSDRASLIELDAGTLRESQRNTLVDDPTDSLILHCILAHARSASFTAKILLTENRKDFDSELVRTECAKVGLVSFFNRTEPFLKWLGFQPPS